MNIHRAQNWETLKASFPANLVDAIRALFDRGGPFEISARELCAEIGCDETVATSLLESLTPPLTSRVVVVCRNCHNEIQNGGPLLRCRDCGSNLTEEGATERRCTFFFMAARTRDVSWVLALHGMNTRGTWQEEFNWRVSTSYKRSVPVAIYKYGIVRPGVLSKWYLRRLEQNIVERIAALQGRTEEEGFVGPPDVIAHSLGTWLIGHALQNHPNLKIGRLLLTGSILRPDFDWGRLYSNEQIQAVLNHYGTRDRWAAVAHYVIPDSGPSGNIGFTKGSAIMQERADGYRHSDYFDPEHLPKVLEQVWRPFLTSPAEELILGDNGTTDSWSEAIWPLRATVLRLLLLSLWWIIVLSIPFFLFFGGIAISAKLGISPWISLLASALFCGVVLLLLREP